MLGWQQVLLLVVKHDKKQKKNWPLVVILDLVLLVTILGFIADNFGLPLVMQIVTWLPVAAAIIALKIPIPASLRK